MPRFPRNIDRSPEPIVAPVPACPHDGGVLAPWKDGVQCAVCRCGFVRGAWVAQGGECSRFSSQFRSEIPPAEVATPLTTSDHPVEADA